MHRFAILLIAALVTACASYPPLPVDTKHVQLVNTIHSGDEIRVAIMGEPTLSDVYKVNAGGDITLPLGGDIPVAGLTLNQAGRAISQRLENGYLKHAQIGTSFVKQRDVYVLGEVQRPGNYPYSPDLTVVKAIAQAGGYTYRAAKDNMLLRRQGNTQVSQKYSANEDSLLHPGDSIVVGERFF